MGPSGGMDTFSVDEWRPVFPDPAPLHWIAFVATDDGLTVLTDVQLDPRLRVWLEKWLAAHSSHQPHAEASYVYLGLGSELGEGVPDGVKSPGSPEWGRESKSPTARGIAVNRGRYRPRSDRQSLGGSIPYFRRRR